MEISNMKDSMERQSYFKSMARIFYRVMETMQLLHEKEFLNGDPENVSEGSSPIILNDIDEFTFGIVDQNTFGRDVPDGRIVITDPLNLTKSMSPEHLKKLTENLGLIESGSYTEENQMNINYIQIFNLFLSTVKWIGGEDSFFSRVKLEIVFEKCFLDRNGKNIFKNCECPIFLLQALNMITEKTLEHLYQVLVRKDYTLDHKRTRRGLFQIFYYLMNWGRSVPIPNSFYVEPVYEIYKSKDYRKFLKKDPPGWFAKLMDFLFGWIKRLFKSNDDSKEDGE